MLTSSSLVVNGTEPINIFYKKKNTKDSDLHEGLSQGPLVPLNFSFKAWKATDSMKLWNITKSVKEAIYIYI